MNKLPNSLSILKISLDWTLSWAIGWAVGWPIVAYVGMGMSFTEGGPIGGFLAGMVTGAIGGGIMAAILRQDELIINQKQALLLTVLWAMIYAFDWTGGFVAAAPLGQVIDYGASGPISGLVGGLATAFILRWANPEINWKDMTVITMGWLIGFAVAGFISWTVGWNSAMITVYGRLYDEVPGFSTALVRTTAEPLAAVLAALSGPS